MQAVATLRDRIDLFLHAGEVAIFHEFHKPPYGGGNQFLLALKRELELQGLRVSKNRVGSNTRSVLFNSFNFDFDQIRSLRRRKSLRMVHRVDGPISVYRGTDFEIDEKIFRTNQEVADATIFQSRYSYEKHRELGFEFKNVTVLPNAVDASMFHPAPTATRGEGRLKLIGTAWSNNPKKGLAVYEWLDRSLDFNRYELTFVGRIQSAFRNIRTLDAVPSQELGALLRQHHVYLAPSENDPCSNALIEALATGLPAVFRKSGGHPELAGEGGLGFDRPEEIPSLLERIDQDWKGFRSRIRVATIAEIASGYRKVMGI